jgi:hypothetical protein
MKRNLLIVAALSLAVTMVSCKKDIEEMENTYPANTSSSGALANFKSQHAPPLQTFTFTASTGTFIVGTNGTEITVAPNAFLYPNNQPAVGTITINLREVRSKKDMYLSGGYTQANDQVIVSGGEIYLDAWQGAQELHLTSNSVVQVSIPTPVSEVMYEFYANTIGPNSDFNQVANPQPITVGIDSSSWYSYDFYIDGLHWINCDYFYGSTAPKTRLGVALPTLFDYSNCEVILVLRNLNALINCYPDPATGMFMSAEIPIGEEFDIISIAEINGNFYYGQSSGTLEEDQVMGITPALSTEAIILANLSAL